MARYLSLSDEKYVDQHLYGWVSTEQLIRDLGMTESHINIQIHRARKQFSDKLAAHGIKGDMLIQRKKGKVCFGYRNYQII